MDGERSGVRDDGGPEASAGRYLDLRREDVLLLFRRMQGVARSDSREVREVTSLLGRRLTGKGLCEPGGIASRGERRRSFAVVPVHMEPRLIRGPPPESRVDRLPVHLPLHGHSRILLAARRRTETPRAYR